jgi:hypothetical protein
MLKKDYELAQSVRRCRIGGAPFAVLLAAARREAPSP